MLYVISKVSEQEPREYYNETYKSTTYYIKVQLEGVERPVSIGKKTKDALKVGDEVSGTIISEPNYGEDKFKSEPKMFTPGAPGASGPKKEIDHDSMFRCNALNNAVTIGGDMTTIVANADDFLTWLKNEPKTGYEKARDTAEALKPKQELKEEEEPNFMDDDINFDEIPF